MLLYEVNLSIAPEIAQEYDSWLPKHIHHLLALPGFISAEVYQRDPDPEEVKTDWLLLSVQYSLKDREALDDYLAHHAPKMRQAVIDLFGDRVRISRRQLELKETFVKKES